MRSSRPLSTGGAGFIGSTVIRHLLVNTVHVVAHVDKLTYAGNLDSLAGAVGSDRYSFHQLDICNQESTTKLFSEFQPDLAMHLAAEFMWTDRSTVHPISSRRILSPPTAFWRLLVPTGKQCTPRAGLTFASTTSRLMKCTAMGGKQAPMAQVQRPLILRTSWIFGVQGKNFGKTMLKMGNERVEVRVVADQRGCPTSTTGIAACLWKLTARYQKAGDLHYHFARQPVTGMA